MNINGREFSEPELRAYIKELQAKVEKFEKAKEIMNKTIDVINTLCFAVSEPTGCEFCPYDKTNPDGACNVETLTKAIEEVIKNG